MIFLKKVFGEGVGRHGVAPKKRMRFCLSWEYGARIPVFAAKFARKGGCTCMAYTVEGVKEKPLQTAVKGENGHGVFRMGGGTLIIFLFVLFRFGG